jgi:uncharacterized repeat protein (TIGR03803 family)
VNKRGVETVLHTFVGGSTDGCYASGTLVLDGDNNLYGTTTNCGSDNAGIVWKLGKDGIETALHSFAGGASDGSTPTAGVTRDANGDLFGGTDFGGTSNKGTVYKLNKEGLLTLLHGFDGSDGNMPLDTFNHGCEGKPLRHRQFGRQRERWDGVEVRPMSAIANNRVAA